MGLLISYCTDIKVVVMTDLWSMFFTRLDAFTGVNTKLEDFHYAVHVSLMHKYIFVENPKVACSTIKKTLQGLELNDSEYSRDESQGLHMRDFSPLLSLRQLSDFEVYFERDDFVVFCFVRNPYARLLSGYLDKIQGPRHSLEFKAGVLKTLGYDEIDLDQHVTFEEFISVIEKQTPFEMDYHWR